MELVKGRPADCASRLPKEQKCYDFLDSLGISYERVDHDPAMTMEVCAEIDQTLGAPTCKNLFLCNRQQTDFYVLMIPADKVFKTKDLSAQIGSARLSFGSHEKMEEMLDITPGSLTVLGLLNDPEGHVRLLIDEDVLACESVGFHPCINTSTLRVNMEDFRSKILPALRHTPTVVKL